MKKNIEKIFASASVVVALILIMVLLVTAFGGIETEEFQTNLVQGLLVTLSILYLLLSIITIVIMFAQSDAIKEITLRSEQKGAVKVTANVISKMVKKACAGVEGVKCQKIVILVDEYGVRLKVNIKVVDKDVIEAETYLRTLLEDVFMGEFGFKFHTIEFKIVALTSKYQPDMDAIAKKAAAQAELLKAESKEESIEEVATEEVAEEIQEVQEEVAQAEAVEAVAEIDETEIAEEIAEVEQIEEVVEDGDTDTTVE